MTRTILIPTDLSVTSLRTLRAALDETGNITLNVVLLFAHMPPSDISELLFYSPTRTLRELCSADFNDALEVLRNRHEHKLKHLRVELLHGRTKRALEDFARTHGIEEVHLAEGTRYLHHPQGFDPLPLIMASRLPKRMHSQEPANMPVHEDRLQVLFQP
jgi:hypothetical protein